MFTYIFLILSKMNEIIIQKTTRDFVAFVSGMLPLSFGSLQHSIWLNNYGRISLVN